MKKMIVALMLFMSVPAFASGSAFNNPGLTSTDVRSAGFDTLSESEKVDLLKLVVEKSAASKVSKTNVSEDNSEKVERWVKIGSNIGQGLAGAAKELGVAVNDFSTTTVGQLTIVLIVWHMLGATLVHILGGIMVWGIGFSVIRWYFKQQYPDIVKYSTTQKNIFGNFVKETVSKTPCNDSSGWIAASGLVLVAGIIVLFTF